MVLKINEINEQVFAKLELMPSGTGSLQGDRYTGKFLAPILCLAYSENRTAGARQYLRKSASQYNRIVSRDF